jgi:hypothetical protein
MPLAGPMTGNDKNKGRSRQPMPFAPDRPPRITAKARAFGAVSVAMFALGFAPALRAEVPFAQMVVDANTGRVLHAANPDGQAHPASLAKIMTLYLVFEAMDKGQLSPYEHIRVSKTAAAQSPSKLNVPAGNAVLVRDAVLAVAAKSANDMAVALAERVAGSEADFARTMTDKARAVVTWAGCGRPEALRKVVERMPSSRAVAGSDGRAARGSWRRSRRS